MTFCFKKETGVFLLLCAGMLCRAEPMNTALPHRLSVDLSGDLWKLEGALPGRGLAEKFPEINHDHMGDAYNWSPAHVPGDVFTDLWRIGRIDDPHYGRNSVRAKWVNEYEWWYMRFFNVPEGMQGKQVEVTFDGVDYACDVYLNGALLGSHEGMFTPFSFDITEGVSFEQTRRGRNLLAVRLHPAPRRITLLGTDIDVKWEDDTENFYLTMPEAEMNEIATVVKLELE